mgnify:CR=1 FL=1
MPYKTKICDSHAVSSGSLWTNHANSQKTSRTVIAMRWENLFRDLEEQLDQELAYAAADLARDRERLASTQLEFGNTIRTLARGHSACAPMHLSIGGRNLWISVDNSGRDWVSGTVTEPAALLGYVVANIGSVDALDAPPALIADITAPPVSERSARLSLAERITFRIVLRDLARRRKPVTIHSPLGESYGTIDRVGSDFVVLAAHARSHSRRNGQLTSALLLKITAIYWICIDD